VNAGTYPLNPTTAVGQLRVQLGDIAATDDPSLPTGQRSYAVFSDNSLSTYLAMAGGDVLLAAGRATQSIALAYAQEGNTSVKADDLGLSISGRGASMLDIANSFFKEARAAAAAEAADIFLIASGPTNRPCDPFDPNDLETWTPVPNPEPETDVYDGGLL
jgi:hypothetical protein